MTIEINLDIDPIKGTLGVHQHCRHSEKKGEISLSDFDEETIICIAEKLKENFIDVWKQTNETMQKLKKQP